MARWILIAPMVAAVLVAQVAAQCSWNGYDLSGISMTKLTINQDVPAWNQKAPKQWQISLCSPQTYASCPTTTASYIVEIDEGGTSCDIGFNTPQGGWTSNYGGANIVWIGTYTNPGDRIANVTLLCDPSATQLTSAGDILAYADGSNNWHFNIVLNTNAICGGNPPPPPPPPPPPTTYNPACQWSGINLGLIPVSTVPITMLQTNTGASWQATWQFSVCNANLTACPDAPPSYVVEYAQSGGCSAAFSALPAGQWATQYGGAHATFIGSVNSPGDRVANVTLVCDPGVTQLTPFYLDPTPVTCDQNDMCRFDVRLRSNVVCAGGAAVERRTRGNQHRR